jgi:hypothetical protein
MWNVIGYLILVVCISGNVGVILKRRWGLGLWIVADLAAMVRYASLDDWPSFFQFTLFLALAVWGWMKWKPEQKQ